MIDSGGQGSPAPEIHAVETDPSNRYTRFDEVLGRGATKTVYKAFDEVDGIEVAWNQVKVNDLMSSQAERERLFAEIRVLKQLKHKNIMTFYDSWLDQKNATVNFITELFTSGTLRQYRKRHKHTDEQVLKRWSWQILQGLVYLHGHNPPIIHRDLKCDNIFVNGTSGVIKIGDLGLATLWRGVTAPQSVLGTPEFMAPELYEEKYNEKVDVYSFGMCLLELATMEYPYAECKNAAQIYRRVTQGMPPAALASVQSTELSDFVLMCIDHNPDRRPEARQLLKHSFFDSVRTSKLACPAGGPSSGSATPGGGILNGGLAERSDSARSVASAAGGNGAAPAPANGHPTHLHHLGRHLAGVAAAAALVAEDSLEARTPTASSEGEQEGPRSDPDDAAHHHHHGHHHAHHHHHHGHAHPLGQPNGISGLQSSTSRSSFEQGGAYDSTQGGLEGGQQQQEGHQGGNGGGGDGGVGRSQWPPVPGAPPMDRMPSLPLQAPAAAAAAGGHSLPLSEFVSPPKASSFGDGAAASRSGSGPGDASCEASPAHETRDFSVRCKEVEESKLSFQLKFTEPEGASKTVEFSFDLGEDTAECIAGEMMEDLSLSAIEAQSIACKIRLEIERMAARSSAAAAAAPGGGGGSGGGGAAAAAPPSSVGTSPWSLSPAALSPVATPPVTRCASRLSEMNRQAGPEPTALPPRPPHLSLSSAPSATASLNGDTAGSFAPVAPPSTPHAMPATPERTAGGAGGVGQVPGSPSAHGGSSQFASGRLPMAPATSGEAPVLAAAAAVAIDTTKPPSIHELIRAMKDYHAQEAAAQQASAQASRSTSPSLGVLKG